MSHDNNSLLLLQRIEDLEKMVIWLAEVSLAGVPPTGRVKEFLAGLPKYDRSFIKEIDRKKRATPPDVTRG
jgi:hypothetical protein